MQEGSLITGGREIPGPGFFIQPTGLCRPSAWGAYRPGRNLRPVLAVIKAGSFEEAIEIGNNTEYGLTGSVYTQNTQRIAKAAEDFFVGNLYFNRQCTGALVGGHPFGGFNMSGTNSKAGGRDYLLLFTQAKAVAEKICLLREEVRLSGRPDYHLCNKPNQ